MLLRISKEVGLIGLLTSPQAIYPSLMGSVTIDFEAGERLGNMICTLFLILNKQQVLLLK
jgi:hypothetical protein